MNLKQALANEKSSIAESATGIYENPSGIGEIYDINGNELTIAQAKAIALDGQAIEIPNAGAGSYYKVFCKTLGFDEIEPIEWGATCGDWTFGVRSGDGWFAVFQNNRYPLCGFQYIVSLFNAADSFEELCELMAAGE